MAKFKGAISNFGMFKPCVTYDLVLDTNLRKLYINLWYLGYIHLQVVQVKTSLNWYGYSTEPTSFQFFLGMNFGPNHGQVLRLLCP